MGKLMIWGIGFNNIDSKLTLESVQKAFKKHLIIEVAGRKDGVLKIMHPLTIEDNVLIEGLNIVEEVIKEVLG